MDTVPDDAACRHYRPGHHRPDRGDHEHQAASQQGFRACLGILRLARSYGSARVEAACRRGNEIGATTYGSIASILKNGLDQAYTPEPTPEAPPIRHGNIRGTGYYH